MLPYIIKPLLEKTETMLRATRDTIFPFTEKPTKSPEESSTESIEASDLFSFFTADIIKQKVLFTR